MDTNQLKYILTKWGIKLFDKWSVYLLKSEITIHLDRLITSLKTIKYWEIYNIRDRYTQLVIYPYLSILRKKNQKEAISEMCDLET
jgi:hypothetical protein